MVFSLMNWYLFHVDTDNEWNFIITFIFTHSIVKDNYKVCINLSCEIVDGSDF